MGERRDCYNLPSEISLWRLPTVLLTQEHLPLLLEPLGRPTKLPWNIHATETTWGWYQQWLVPNQQLRGKKHHLSFPKPRLNPVAVPSMPASAPKLPRTAAHTPQT